MTLQRHFELFLAMTEKLSPGGVAVVTVPDDFDVNILSGFLRGLWRTVTSRGAAGLPQGQEYLHADAHSVADLVSPCLAMDDAFSGAGCAHLYYLSHKPMTRLRRSPNPPARYIKEDMLGEVIR